MTLLSGDDALETAKLTPVAAASATRTVAMTPINLPTAYSRLRVRGVNLPVGKASHNTLKRIKTPAEENATMMGTRGGPSGGFAVGPGTR